MSAMGSCCDGEGARGAADWLALAATPIFALMAVVTIVFGGGPVICSVMPVSPLNGMAAMYALMSIFHAPSWLKRMSRRR